jgi:hypothetical protein
MQDLSYQFNNTYFCTEKYQLSVMIYTFSNAYSLDPEKTETEKAGNAIDIKNSGLLCCGGQEKAQGNAHVRIEDFGSQITVKISASVKNVFEEIRCAKLKIEGLEYGAIVNLIDAREKKIDEKGVILRYPEGWRDVGTPLLILKNKDGYTYLRSEDRKVRDKTFVFQKAGDHLDGELVFEEEASKMSNHIDVPLWVIGKEENIGKVYEPHIANIEKAYALKSWEDREDVPDWAREISLIVSVHAQHWTGYIFNDYEQILQTIRYVASKIEAKRMLVYIPGFEGRYYWKYGNFCPDERMGGEEGFKKLCDEARKLGVHLMPMFGINIAGNNWDNYVEWGEPSQMLSASGNIRQGSVDWDGSRHYDHSSNRNLNPGAPKWQNRLSSQIIDLAHTYGFDAVFLDIAAVWQNDPNFNVYEGAKQLVKRLHQGIPNLLVAGEGWYDGLMNFIPLIQSGHTDGKLHFHDEAYAPAFDKYCREFAHLCLGDPSRNSTGVHEQGYNPEWRIPLRKGLIPTVTIVDGTMEKARDKVDAIIEDAKEYAELYLR